VTNAVNGNEVHTFILSYITSNKWSSSSQPWLPFFFNWPVELLNPLSATSKTDSTICISRVKHNSYSSCFQNWINPKGSLWLNVISPWFTIGCCVIDDALVPWSGEIFKMKSLFDFNIVEIMRSIFGHSPFFFTFLGFAHHSFQMWSSFSECSTFMICKFITVNILSFNLSVFQGESFTVFWSVEIVPIEILG